MKPVWLAFFALTIAGCQRPPTADAPPIDISTAAPTPVPRRGPIVQPHVVYDDPDQAALELIKLSGQEAIIKTSLMVMTQQMPPQQAKAIRGMINVSELSRRLIPVFKKHFSLDETNDLIDFYKSPVGMKVKQLSPTLFKEGAEIGQKYVEEKMAATRSAR